MKSQQLIAQFEQTIKAEKDAKESVFNAKIAAAKSTFESSCLRHLGDLKDELNPSEVEFRFGSNGHRENSIAVFTMKVSFMFLAGTIEQTYRIAEDKWDSARLDFGLLRLSKDHLFQAYVDLPATDLQIGQILAMVARYAPIRAERIAHDLEDQLKRFMDFGNIWAEQNVVQHLNAGIEAFPDSAEALQEQARTAANRIQARRREEEEKQLAYDLVESERAQLSRMQEYAWSKPFDVFKVEYGAHVINDCEDDDAPLTITKSFYTNMQEADADGYWSAFENGKLSRHIKPINIISVEIIHIADYDQAPFELRRQVDLQSKAMTDVRLWTYLPAAEFFTFDYDEIKIALESGNDQTEA